MDKQIVLHLDARECQYRQDFEFRRYVDDYYMFSRDADVAKKVLSAINTCLSQFNMHLNDEKTLSVVRPFITVKSRLIRDANRSLEEFFAKFIKMGSSPDGSYSYPKRVRRAGALLRSLLDSIKGTSFDHQAGYSLTSNYIIGALSTRIAAVISDYEKGIAHENVTEDDYVGCLLLLLEAIYFFYNVDPTVPSSLRVSQAAIQCAEFFKTKLPSRTPFLAEQIVRWTFQFIRSLKGSTVHHDTSCVPLEALNILLVFGEVGREDALAQQTITEFCGTFKSLDYFEIVSFLFCMGSHTGFAALRDSLFERSRSLLSSGLGVRTDAHAAHLALDLLSCPHLDRATRATLFNELRAQMELPQASNADADAAVEAFEANPWFVDWKSTNLLRMIRKKELSDVY